MLPEVKQKVEEETAAEDFFKNLSESYCNFNYNKIFAANDDDYEIFNYTNETTHRGLKTYFHAETGEYRLSKVFGLNEFCLTEFIAEDIKTFVETLQKNLMLTLEALDKFDGDKNIFVEEKKIPAWTFGKKLKTEIEDFELFIKPSSFLEITNGSFVIINYCDFSINSDLAVIYNVFTDDFGCEARIKGSPTVIYDFDTDDLNELEEKLRNGLAKRLRTIRSDSENLS